jgi:NTE family protein
LTPILARHGLALDEAVLRDRSRTLMPKEPEKPRLESVLKRLSATLGQLEPLLHTESARVN